MRPTEPLSTDRLLSLGMALYADKKTMERRIHGIFARPRSAAGAVLASILLTASLGFACFTTACQPVRTQQAPPSDLPEPKKTETLVTVQPTGGPSDYASSNEYRVRLIEHETGRAFPAPAISNIYRGAHGDWTTNDWATADQTPEASAAIAAFLPAANAIFRTNYTADQARAIHYRDETGFRADLWRIETRDDAIHGAVEADTLAFLCADSLIPPADAAPLHASAHSPTGLDPRDAIDRVCAALGGSVKALLPDGGFRATRPDGDSVVYGWMAGKTCGALLEDGRVYLISLFADDALTVCGVGVCPDEDCMREGVYWRADLETNPEVVRQVAPQDFRRGTPGSDDMPAADAFDLYYRLVLALGPSEPITRGQLAEPSAVFYADHSGARENYWRIEGEYAAFDLSSRSGQLRNVRFGWDLGFALALTDIPYAQMGGDAYAGATQALFETLFGAGSVVRCGVNAVWDDRFCTMDLVMADGSAYEALFDGGRLRSITFFTSGDFQYVNWEADSLFTNIETGETFHVEI